MTFERNLHDKIRIFRGLRVMLDVHLADIYGVTTQRLHQQVSRNRKRFPEDFMFRLSASEFKNLMLQNAASSSHGGRRKPPLVFTQEGAAMLSSVLRSGRAVEANIAIMRAFVKVREISAQNREILSKLDQLERRVDRHEADIGALIDAIREDVSGPVEEPKRRIGFQRE